jgi:DNA polymerase III epsilon subunit-like protein
MVDYDAHDAVEDCKATVELLRRMIEKHGTQEVIYKTIEEDSKPKVKKTRYKKVRE